MIVYNKLSELLKMRNMVWKDLIEAGVSVNTLTRFSLGKAVNTDTIDKVCKFLHVQPGDIMEWVENEDDLKKIELRRQIEAMQKELAELENKGK